MTHRTAVLVAAAIVAVPLIGYPALVAADGARFPSADDCVAIAAAGDEGELDLVFGRRDTPAEAEALLEQVRGRRVRRRGRRRRRLRALEGALRRDHVVRARPRVARRGPWRRARGGAGARACVMRMHSIRLMYI